MKRSRKNLLENIHIVNKNLLVCEICQNQLNKPLLPYKNIYQIVSAKTLIKTYVKICFFKHVYRMFSYELYILNCEQQIISLLYYISNLSQLWKLTVY